jgi:hypothetical protein
MKANVEELDDLYSSPNIILMIKLRRMRWVRHVACMGGGEVHTRFWWGNLREGDDMEDPGEDGRIILRWILGKWDAGQVAGSCELGNEPSSFIKCGEFLY